LNNNPSCQEFKNIFKRLVMHAGAIPSPNANIEEFSNLEDIED